MQIKKHREFLPAVLFLCPVKDYLITQYIYIIALFTPLSARVSEFKIIII